ncbi:hypothetical protein ERJ75_001426200 [Trypanosoma vivax]|uniref:Uncharacterized protein n=1 Tax=Trypanosoma vivax (strain Y486) TaxID=1055687 RepID=G0TUM5_TRYVY|nr:hypothetical protein TRVL_06215 [Trypanosoma vivax]KAH8607205.1 hypothetical protein ERJ75_001426200 [Trypanosoma vivax]CCC47660.1 conserved hypothetical protein [Trypanosoma vivax Y486]
MSLREDIEALSAALRRLSRVQDRGNSSTATEVQADDTISAISMAAEEGEQRDNCGMSPWPSGAAAQTEGGVAADETHTGIPSSSNTTALPCSESTFTDALHSHKLKKTSSFLPTSKNGTSEKVPNGEPVVLCFDRSEFIQTNVNTPQGSVSGGNLVKRTIGEDLVSSSGDTVLTEPSTMESNGCHTKEAYKRVARRLLAEIQRLDSCVTAVSAHRDDERKDWLYARRELEVQLRERDRVIGELQERLRQRVNLTSAESRSNSGTATTTAAPVYQGSSSIHCVSRDSAPPTTSRDCSPTGLSCRDGISPWACTGHSSDNVRKTVYPCAEAHDVEKVVYTPLGAGRPTQRNVVVEAARLPVDIQVPGCNVNSRERVSYGSSVRESLQVEPDAVCRSTQVPRAYRGGRARSVGCHVCCGSARALPSRQVPCTSSTGFHSSECRTPQTRAARRSRSVSQPPRVPQAVADKRKWKQQEEEDRLLLRKLLDKNAALEESLRYVMQRLDEQQVELRGVSSILSELTRSQNNGKP